MFNFSKYDTFKADMADRASNIKKASDISGIEYICFNTGQCSLHHQYYYLDYGNQFSLEKCQLQSYHIVIQSLHDVQNRQYHSRTYRQSFIKLIKISDQCVHGEKLATGTARLAWHV